MEKLFMAVQNDIASPVPMAHIYNPSHSEGRDQEDHSSRPAQKNSSRHPISKIPNTKKVSSGRVPAQQA
jgi:hypothetical protein